MAEEAKAKGAHVILGPNVNMQRGPLGGRGFESFSEDPLLSGSCHKRYAVEQDCCDYQTLHG